MEHQRQTQTAAEKVSRALASLWQAVARVSWMTALTGTGAFLLGAFLVVWALFAVPKPNFFGVTPDRFDTRTDTSGEVLTLDAREQLPNIVFILVDDLGYGDLGAYGPSPIRTPNLDQLAEEGARFTDFYAPASICSPSRAGFLTGRYPVRMGITFPYQPPEKKDLATRLMNRGTILLAELGALDMRANGNLVDGLPTSEITIAEGLRSAGYATGIVGKWHLGDYAVSPEHHPFNHGFDYVVGFPASNDEYPVSFYRGTEKISSDIGLDQAPYTGLFTDAAIEFVSENKDRPFFLFLSHKDPHQPFYPSEGFAGKSSVGPYGDTVEELDHNVGRLLNEIDRLGLADNTLVIFTSDNGPWYEGSPGGLRGRKGMSFDGGYRVPFLMKFPNRIEPGTVMSRPAMGIDLLPTMFSVAGVNLPQDRTIDGISLVDKSGALLPDETSRNPLFFFSGYDFEAVRDGDFKYIDRNNYYSWPIPLDKPIGLMESLSPVYQAPDGSYSIPKLHAWPKLFNLRIDPSESYDVMRSHPDETERLGALLDQWREDFLEDPQAITRENDTD